MSQFGYKKEKVIDRKICELVWLQKIKVADLKICEPVWLQKRNND